MRFEDATEPLPLTREVLMELPDGCWVLTNREMTMILDAIHEPRAAKPPRTQRGWWWRRKQVLDFLGEQFRRIDQ